MKNFFKNASAAQRSGVAHLPQKFAGFLVSLTFIGGFATLMAEGSKAQGSAAADPAVTPAQMADGVYLYGQSAQPQTIGSEYLVFEVTAGSVVGGFYMPRSSFDCFHGSLQAEKLALTVIDSYEQTAHPYSVALAAGEPTASAGGSAAPLGLEGYHRIAELSEIDQQVLTTCKASQI